MTDWLSRGQEIGAQMRALVERVAAENRDLTDEENERMEQLDGELVRITTELLRESGGDEAVRSRVAELRRRRERIERTAKAAGKPMTRAQALDYEDSTRHLIACYRALGYGTLINRNLSYGGTREEAIAEVEHELDTLSRADAPEARAARQAIEPLLISESSKMTAHQYPAVRALFMDTEYGERWGFEPNAEYRSITTTSGGTALYTIGFDNEFHRAVARESILLNTAPTPRVYTIDNTEFRIAAGTAIASAEWIAEGGTATAADEGVTSVRILPDKLMRYQIVSNEALEDANFDVIEPLAAEMFRSFGQALDNAAYGTAGNSANLTGLLTQAGAGTATNSNAAVTSLDPFVSAAGSALAAGNNIGDLVWVSGAAVWTHLGQVHIGGTANDVRPLLQTNANLGGAAIAGEILGRPYYVTASTGMAGGTAAKVLLYDPQELAVVFARRYTVTLDRTTRAESDETRIIATMRVGVKPIHTKGFALLDGIDTT